MFDAEALIQVGGLLLILLALYAQTGLFFCFFVPSGAFVFTAGVLIANDLFAHDLFVLCSLGTAACLLGNITGYAVGYKAGPLLYRKRDTFFFKKKHITSAENFFKKYGAFALAIGVFFPLVRTFGPIVAGIIKEKFGRVALFTFIGSAGWVVSFAIAGYLIGSMPFLRPYLNYVIIVIVVVVTIPVAVRVIRGLNTGG